MGKGDRCLTEENHFFYENITRDKEKTGRRKCRKGVTNSTNRYFRDAIEIILVLKVKRKKEINYSNEFRD